jgi:hypothetical protein
MTGQWQTWSHGSFCARKTVGTIDAIELGRERRHALPPLPAALVGRLVSPITPVSPYHPYPVSTQNRVCSNGPSARLTTFVVSHAA